MRFLRVPPERHSDLARSDGDVGQRRCSDHRPRLRPSVLAEPGVRRSSWPHSQHRPRRTRECARCRGELTNWPARGPSLSAHRRSTARRRLRSGPRTKTPALAPAPSARSCSMGSHSAHAASSSSVFALRPDSISTQWHSARTSVPRPGNSSPHVARSAFPFGSRLFLFPEVVVLFPYQLEGGGWESPLLQGGIGIQWASGGGSQALTWRRRKTRGFLGRRRRTRRGRPSPRRTSPRRRPSRSRYKN